MSQQGWIKLHRQLKDCWIYEDKPYDRTHAWIDLLLRANHSDKKVMLGNELVEVKRGSFITSELKLCDAWGWSKTKLRSFLRLLEADNMIEVFSDHKKTTINIVNYSVYQDIENQEKTAEKPPENHEETVEEPKKNTNKNDKNNKNDKEDIIVQQVEKIWSMYPEKKGKKKAIQKIPKLIKQYGFEQIQRCIERYIQYVDYRHHSDFPNLKYQNGSTFFNGTFIDYLDENWKGENSDGKADRCADELEAEGNGFTV